MGPSTGPQRRGPVAVPDPEDQPRAGQGWGSKSGAQYVFRVKVPAAVREAMEADAQNTGRAFGLIAYEAIVRNLSALRQRLAPDRPEPGMPPIRQPRFYTSGSAPKVDLYLSVDERDAVVRLCEDLGVRPSSLFREALMLWVQGLG